jgi:hypothetical protein
MDSTFAVHSDEEMVLGPLWSPAVRDEPIPRDFEYSERPLHFLDSPAFADNFGHFLVDHMLAALTGMLAYAHVC